MLPEILERGGPLFEVVNFGPPFIGRALALGHALLDVDDQIDALQYDVYKRQPSASAISLTLLPRMM